MYLWIFVCLGALVILTMVIAFGLFKLRADEYSGDSAALAVTGGVIALCLLSGIGMNLQSIAQAKFSVLIINNQYNTSYSAEEWFFNKELIIKINNIPEGE